MIDPATRSLMQVMQIGTVAVVGAASVYLIITEKEKKQSRIL